MEQRPPAVPLLLLLVWVAPLTRIVAPLMVVCEERPSEAERATGRLEKAPPLPAAIGDTALADAPRRAGRLWAAESCKKRLPLSFPSSSLERADIASAYGTTDDIRDILERDGVSPPWALLMSEAMALPPGLTCHHMMRYKVHQVTNTYIYCSSLISHHVRIINHDLSEVRCDIYDLFSKYAECDMTKV